MSSENYLNHPNFGLLYRICLVDQQRELFSTLYAQRLFFVVGQRGAGLEFEAISRTEAKLMVEAQLRNLRREGSVSDVVQLQKTYQQTF
jgi:PII interaction protein X